MSEENFYEKLQDSYTIANNRKNENPWANGAGSSYQPVSTMGDAMPANAEGGSNNDDKNGKKKKKEKKVKPENKIKKTNDNKKSNLKAVLLVVAALFFVSIVVVGVIGVKVISEKSAYKKVMSKYTRIVDEGKGLIENEEYAEAIDVLEEALELDVDDYEEAYKFLGRAYIRMAGDCYSDSNSYLKMREYDTAKDLIEEAKEHLNSADKYWKGEKFRFSEVAFYSCNSISDAETLVLARQKEIEDLMGYELLAIDVLGQAEGLLADYDYKAMNTLDTSDEADLVYEYFITTQKNNGVIMYTDEDGVQRIADNHYTGKGVAIYGYYSGFYFYSGDIVDGEPDGCGIGYISSSNGTYKVQDGDWKYGYPYGKMTFTSYNGECQDVYTGKCYSYGFDGKVSLERTDKLGKVTYGTIKYNDGSIECLDYEAFEELVEEYELDPDTVYFWDNTYACALFDKNDEFVTFACEYDIATLNFSL